MAFSLSTWCQSDGRTLMKEPELPSIVRAASSSPVHGGHAVQFYQDDSFLVESVSGYVGAALASGDAAVIIATKPHRTEINELLKARGLDLAKVVNQGRYFALDAHDTLSRFMRNGLPDAGHFKSTIATVLDQAVSAVGGDHSRVAAFGEMVQVLWAARHHEAALKLEQLWNELARHYSFSLLCAYPIAGFKDKRHANFFQRICAEHTAVLPTESYSLLGTEEARLRKVSELQLAALTTESSPALTHSEESFRLFVEAVSDYAIFMLDATGNVITWNKGAERIKGYKAWEIIGKHFSTFYPENDLRARKPWYELEVAAKEGRFEDEGWRLRKDGSRFWANVVITALKDEGGRVLGYGKVTRDFTERVRAQEALQRAYEQLQKEILERTKAEEQLHRSEESLRKLSLHLLRTQDEERRRIGRDLHDSLGQYLAVLKINLDSVQQSLQAGRHKAQAQLRQCIRLAEDAVKEVRTISYLLYPPMLEELGLKSAIPWYVEGFSRRSGIKARLEISSDFGRFSRDLELALFRVLQESLTNVHRHSGSRTADIRLHEKDDMVILEIEDRGKGFAPGVLETNGNGLPANLGVGLRGMNERMRQLGGKIEVVSAGKGTLVRAVVPPGNRQKIRNGKVALAAEDYAVIE
jgi:PAS domain S-box-containing protein